MMSRVMAWGRAAVCQTKNFSPEDGGKMAKEVMLGRETALQNGRDTVVICTHTHIYVCTFLFSSTYVCICTCICICITCMYICVCTYIYISVGQAWGKAGRSPSAMLHVVEHLAPSLESVRSTSNSERKRMFFFFFPVGVGSK